MRKVERIEQFKIVEYIGNCPKCGEEYRSNNPDANETCYSCREKEENQKVKDYYKWLLDAKIVDIKGSGYISTITVEFDNKRFDIKSEGHGHYLNIEEL